MKNIGTAGASNIYLSDFRLYDLSLLLMNVLERQGVNLTDGTGTTYAEGSDYTVEYGALPIKTGVRVGKDFVTYWSETQTLKNSVFNADGALKGTVTKILWTGTTRPERVYMIYSSLFPSNQGNTCCAFQFHADATQDDYYMQ